MKLNLSVIIYAIPVLFLAWVVLSWINVLACQDCGGTQNTLNFFVIITSFV